MINANVTIIVPVFNVAQYILELYHSLQMDKYNFQLIFVDDGSTDNTMDELIKLQSKMKNADITVIQQKNSGPSSARNTGILRATKEYIMFIDGDDLLTENGPKIIVSQSLFNVDVIVMAEFVDASISGETVQLIDNKNRADLMSSVINKSSGIFHNDDFVEGKSVSKLFKTDFLKKNNIIFDEQINYAEDTLFDLQVIRYAHEVHFEHTGIYLYRNNPESITHIKSRVNYFENDSRYLFEMLKVIEAEKINIDDVALSNYLSLWIYKMFVQWMASGKSIVILKKNMNELWKIVPRETLFVKSNGIFNFHIIICKMLYNNNFTLTIVIYKIASLIKLILRRFKNKKIESKFKLL